MMYYVYEMGNKNRHKNREFRKVWAVNPNYQFIICYHSYQLSNMYVFFRLSDKYFAVFT